MEPVPDGGPALDREVHVVTTSRVISNFLRRENNTIICFRCGEQGHVRSQCLTYKIHMCNFHRMGRCNDPFCTFAHDASELRQPWRPRCVRVVKQGGEFVCIGCNSTEHTFRKCPLHQDLVFL